MIYGKQGGWIDDSVEGIYPVLTIEGLEEMRFGPFASGVGEVPSAEGEFTTSEPVMRVVKWVAWKKKTLDWTIYYMNGTLNDEEDILQNGSRLVDTKYVREFVPCTDEALSYYHI